MQWVLVAGLALALVVAVLFFARGQRSEVPRPGSPTPQATPDPSPTPELNEETRELDELLRAAEADLRRRPSAKVLSPEELAEAKRELAELESPAPPYSDELVRETVFAEFPNQVDQATGELMRYGVERHEAEVHRVRIAVLKNSKGSLSLLRGEVDAATRDYRDVLMRAEYPEYSSLSPATEGVQAESARVRDRLQYLKWLVGR